MSAVQTLLVTVLVLATSVWLGGYTAIAVVAHTTSRTLEAQHRVDFFRALGRTFLPIGGTALVLAYASGLALILRDEWTPTATAAVVVAVLLVVVLAVAVRQARALTRLRSAALTESEASLPRRISGRARAAGWLRAVIGLLSVVLVVLGAVLTS